MFLRWLLDRERERFKELLLLFVGVLRVIAFSAEAAIILAAFTLTE